MSIGIRAIERDTNVLLPQEAMPSFFQFPGGEWDLKVKPDTIAPVTWVAIVRGADANDLAKAAILANYAYHYDDKNAFALLLPYAPAARADRGTPCGAQVYAAMVNEAIDPDWLVTLDIHSPLARDRYDPIIEADPVPLVLKAMEGSLTPIRYSAVIAPDHGAKDRAKAVADALGVDYYEAEKKRDFETGKILDWTIEELPKSGHYLVVDDICDGGGTFMRLAEVTGLPKERLGLWVTHGIFSGNADQLTTRYAKIMTTDSHPGHSRVGLGQTIVPVVNHMLSYIPKD